MAERMRVQQSDLSAVGSNTPAGAYLRRYWQPVMRAQDLPLGRAKPLEILGEKFTIYRGESGEPHIVQQRCAHRGVPLHLGWVQGDDLRCRYHGWKYDCTGKCIEMPNNSRVQDVQLRKHPAREYLGFIFAYLGEGAAPAFPRIPPMDQPGVIVTDPIEVVPATFWNRLDNDIDHIPWTHRHTAEKIGMNDLLIPRVVAPAEESAWGWTSTREKRVGGEGVRRNSGYSLYMIMPNILLFTVRTRAKGFEGRELWDTKITWTVPVNDSTFIAFDATLTPLEGDEARAYLAARAGQQEPEALIRWPLAEQILAGELTIEDIPDGTSGYNRFAIEDYATQVGQGQIEGRSEHLVETDCDILLTRRLWQREVSAMLDGRSLTNWDYGKLPKFINEQVAA